MALTTSWRPTRRSGSRTTGRSPATSSRRSGSQSSPGAPSSPIPPTASGTSGSCSRNGTRPSRRPRHACESSSPRRSRGGPRPRGRGGPHDGLREAAREGDRLRRRTDPRGGDECRWPEGRYLTRHDLDGVSTAVSIAAVRVDRHMAAVNSPALGLLKIPPGTRGFETNSAGQPTGILKEDALEAMWDAVRPAPERLAANFREVATRALRLGITGVHDVVGETEIRAYQIARASGTLPLRG